MIDTYDALVLGSGTGGKLIAWHLAAAGRRTAVVERRWIGGSCPNIACMPSKNEISSARVAHLVRSAAAFGWSIEPGRIDMAVVRQRKRDMVAAQVAAHLKNYTESGAELVMGSGHFVAPKTIEVELNGGGTRLLAGDQVFIDVGTHSAIPDLRGLAAVSPLTHIEALELGYLPEHLVVLGGGYVGLELAQAYRRFGSRVTVIERARRLMGREDGDVAAEIQRILSGEGIEFLLGAEIAEVRGKSGVGVNLVVRTESGERTIEGSDILVAAGRVAEHGRDRAQRGRHCARRARLHQGQRAARDDRAGRVGARRVCRKSAVHACLGGRFPDRQRQSCRGQTQHAQQACSLLHVYRPSACPCRTERR